MSERRIAVISAGLSNPSSTRMLADKLAAESVKELAERDIQATVDVIELRDLAHDITNNLLTGFAPAPGLGAAGPWAASLAVAGGLLVLARRRPTIDRWTRLRSRTAPDVPSGDRDGQAVARTGA